MHSTLTYIRIYKIFRVRVSEKRRSRCYPISPFHIIIILIPTKFLCASSA